MPIEVRALFRGMIYFVLASVPMGGALVNSVHRDDNVRMNEIQVIGTHNSYHSGLAPSEAKLLASSDPAESHALDYKHPSLIEQLQAGNRELELDVYPDPGGGRYATSRSLRDVIAAGLPPDDPHYYPEGLMQKPGFKVMHKPDSDYRSNCQPFVECLKQIRSWSNANPNHLPLFLFIETKMPQTLKTQDLDALDAEVSSVFTSSEVISPDVVRGTRASLRDAVQKDGWPTLKQGRGKVVFLMAREEVVDLYKVGHPRLQGRIMFVNGKLDDSDTVFTVQPKNKADHIQQLVLQGMLVLTRCDADTVEARSGDTKRRDNAFESGAQVLSTDYPASEPAKWSGYTVRFSDSQVARCNPVLKLARCSNSELEPSASASRAK